MGSQPHEKRLECGVHRSPPHITISFCMDFACDCESSLAIVWFYSPTLRCLRRLVRRAEIPPPTRSNHERTQRSLSDPSCVTHKQSDGQKPCEFGLILKENKIPLRHRCIVHCTVHSCTPWDRELEPPPSLAPGTQEPHPCSSPIGAMRSGMRNPNPSE